VVSHGWHTPRRVWPPSPFPAHPAAAQDPAGPSWTRLTISPLARTLPASVDPIDVDAFLREEQVAAKLSHVQGNGPWATSFLIANITNINAIMKSERIPPIKSLIYGTPFAVLPSGHYFWFAFRTEFCVR